MQKFSINLERLMIEIFSNIFIGAFEKPPLIFTSHERRKGQ